MPISLCYPMKLQERSRGGVNNYYIHINLIKHTVHVCLPKSGTVLLYIQLVDDWNVDAESYDFEKLDPDNEGDRETVNKFFLWEGDFGNRKVADGKILK